ncbi:MAG: protein-glutamate O-methyltransferase CheR [Myxococcota bacterium]|nr:protein-glutamate O-methyltransferase CheR [Myxococcota bacterium]
MRIDNDIENLEIELLLEAIFQRYGYDFRSYARASISRRIRQFLADSSCNTISEMIPRVLHDETFFVQLIRAFSITVTEMFRDPHVYASIRERVIPRLKTYPFIKIWHVGCATGEEAYSLAIVLKEEGLYDRATIFATDFNDMALAKAKEGIYSLEKAQKFTKNYQSAGGTDSFSSYYQAAYDSMAIAQTLKKNITFANYNLVTDQVFGEMNLIMCRNVLIYFDKSLQNRALGLFSDSLATSGFLCLGDKESLRFSDVSNNFAAVDAKNRIFRKLAAAALTGSQ